MSAIFTFCKPVRPLGEAPVPAPLTLSVRAPVVAGRCRLRSSLRSSSPVAAAAVDQLGAVVAEAGKLIAPARAQLGRSAGAHPALLLPRGRAQVDEFVHPHGPAIWELQRVVAVAARLRHLKALQLLARADFHCDRAPHIQPYARTLHYVVPRGVEDGLVLFPPSDNLDPRRARRRRVDGRALHEEAVSAGEE
ncbi:hypothetical protein T492DRAFT_996152 [Pavlovales sp. CCMP2436]|nr:hypothetical protein T492DRAFT_996152 [Pavlovales sp. CCMP2436]